MQGELVRRWRLHDVRRAPWPLLVACAVVTSAVLLAPDRGDVAIYRQGARAAITTGAVYGFEHRGHGFTYPPFAALVMTPLAVLPNWAMWGCLVAFGVVALGIVLALSLPGAFAAVRRGSTRTAVGLAALVVTEPVVATLRFGQIDLLLAAAVMADVLVLRRGVLLGLAIAMKLTPGLFVVFLLVRGRHREAGTALATFAASVLWGFVILPGTSTTYWTHNALTGSGIGGFTTVGNQSVHGVVSRALGAHLGTDIWLALALPIVVVGLVLAARAATAGLDVLAVGTIGVTACLVSPVSWPHHWVWLLALLGGLWRMPGRDRRLTGWLVGATAFAAVSQVVPLKAIGVGYVPLALVLLTMERVRLKRNLS